MKTEEIVRAYNEVATNIDDDTYISGLTAFATGYLLGGERPCSAMLLIALAEKTYGNPPWLLGLKTSLGLAGSLAGRIDAISRD